MSTTALAINGPAAGVGFVRAQVSFLPGLSGLFGGRGEEFDFSAGTSGAFMRVQLGALSGGSWIFFNALDAVFFFGLCLIAGLAPRAGVRCTVRSRWKSGSA